MLAEVKTAVNSDTKKFNLVRQRNNRTTHINIGNVRQSVVATMCAKKNGVGLARVKSETIVEELSR